MFKKLRLFGVILVLVIGLSSPLYAVELINGEDGSTVGEASESVAGKVELATDTEATTGTATDLATTPANVAAVVAAITPAVHDAVTLNASATTGGLSLSTQEISFRAATNALTGYATASHIGAIEANTAKTGVTTQISNVSEDATPTLGGTLEIDEQTLLVDAALASDHTWTGPTQSVTAGEELTLGEVAYLKSDGKYWLADADAEATADTKIVMVTATIAAEATGIVLLPSSMSFFRDDSTTEWTVTGAGDVVYLDTTDGQITNDVSGYTTGDIVRVVGYMETATVLNFVVGTTFVEVP